MSDLEQSQSAGYFPDVTGDSSGQASTGQPSAGTLLRLVREDSGLNIAALAVLLKVPVKKLEALEADRFDLLPDAVFVRALASSVCRTLKMDATPVLQSLPQNGGPKLSFHGAGLNTPFRTPGDGPGPSVWAQVSRPAVLAGLLLVLGALVLIFLPALQTRVNDVRAIAATNVLETGAAKSSSVLAGSDTRSVEAATPSLSERELLASRGEQSQAMALTPTTDLAAGALTPAAGLAAGSLSSGVLEQPAASGSAASAVTSSGIVVFSAKGQSWVEVTDSRGQVVLRRTLAPGEVAGASGALPLAAVVGRADVTQVQIRGQALDLNALSKDNVARFEVK